jgi:hypothetical protein
MDVTVLEKNYAMSVTGETLLKRDFKKSPT